MNFNHRFNNHLDDIRHWRDHGRNFMSPQKAHLIVEQQKAEEWLSLINSLEDFENHNYELSEIIKQKDKELAKQKIILDEYIKTFWEYKIKQLHWYSSETDIIMPETNSYKFYKSVFNGSDYPYSKIRVWENIKLSIDLLEDGYNIVYKRVNPIKVKAEKKIIPKKKPRWKRE